MSLDFDSGWWEHSWRSRMESVRSAFGSEVPPGQVRTIQFPEPQLTIPGACVITFCAEPDGMSLAISLGLTQPLTSTSRRGSWEFGVYSRGNADWAADLIHDLVIGFAQYPGWLEEGHCLPLAFYMDRHGKLRCGSFVADGQSQIAPIGAIRSLYLWRDLRRPRSIDAAGGSFFIMIATGITRDEEIAGDDTSPPHVLLLLREMGIHQDTDPYRESVFARQGAKRAWNRIRLLSQEEALYELNNKQKGK